MKKEKKKPFVDIGMSTDQQSCPLSVPHEIDVLCLEEALVCHVLSDVRVFVDANHSWKALGLGSKGSDLVGSGARTDGEGSDVLQLEHSCHLTQFPSMKVNFIADHTTADHLVVTPTKRGPVLALKDLLNEPNHVFPCLGVPNVEIAIALLLLLGHHSGHVLPGQQITAQG
jgi:hypothetical protein